MAEPQMPIARKRDFSLTGARKAWVSGGVATALIEVGLILLRYVAGVNFFGVLPPGVAFFVLPLVGGVINFATTWLAKNKPKL